MTDRWSTETEQVPVGGLQWTACVCFGAVYADAFRVPADPMDDAIADCSRRVLARATTNSLTGIEKSRHRKQFKVDRWVAPQDTIHDLWRTDERLVFGYKPRSVSWDCRRLLKRIRFGRG